MKKAVASVRPLQGHLTRQFLSKKKRSVEGYNDMIRAHLDTIGSSGDIDSLLVEMDKHNVTPNSETFSLLLSGGTSLRLVMMAMHNLRIHPSVETTELMLRRASAETKKEVMHVWRHWGTKHQHNRRVFSTFISSLARSGPPRDALAALKGALGKENLKIHIFAFDAILESACKEKDEATVESVINLMKEFKVEPSNHTANILSKFQ